MASTDFSVECRSKLNEQRVATDLGTPSVDLCHKQTNPKFIPVGTRRTAGAKHQTEHPTALCPVSQT